MVVPDGIRSVIYLACVTCR